MTAYVAGNASAPGAVLTGTVKLVAAAIDTLFCSPARMRDGASSDTIRLSPIFTARAGKMGESRIVSDDAPSRILAGEQNNVSIAAATSLTVPVNTAPGALAFPATYAVITAVGGALFATYDGTTPSSVNYAVTLTAGQALPVQGAQALAAIKVQGTTMSVSYWS